MKIFINFLKTSIQGSGPWPQKFNFHFFPQYRTARLLIFNIVFVLAVDLLLGHGFVPAPVVLDVPFGMKNGSLKTLVVMVPEVCYP